MCWFLNILTFVLPSFVMKKISIKKNSAPTLVIGCTLVREKPSPNAMLVVNHGFNCLITALNIVYVTNM